MSERSTATGPVVPPADFWELAEVRTALLNRHFGRFLRVYRAAHVPQVKQAELAEWLGITQGQLSKIERSAASPSDLAKLTRWAQVLHVPADLLWFDLLPAPADVPSSSETATQITTSPIGEGNDVTRRDLLIAAGVVTATAGVGLIANTPWQRLRDSVDNGRPVDPATIQLMEDRTAEFFETERTVPASQMLDLLTKHRAILSTLISNARTDMARNRLTVMLGETDALCGWLYFDLGQGREAANAWRSTLKIAKETGDGALAACALGYWSYLAESRNDIAPAVRLLQQAEEYVPGNSAAATRSWIAAREAEQLSRLGDESNALRALERSFIAFDFARPRVERVWTTFFTANRLGGMTVSTYLALRHPDATAAADSLLTSLPPTSLKSRAVTLTDLATLSVRANDMDRAEAFVADAIDVTTRTQSSMSRQRLVALASALPAARDKTPAGRIREQIRQGLHR
jgi:transcriptional regulator with XRE-family HTH domain